MEGPTSELEVAIISLSTSKCVCGLEMPMPTLPELVIFSRFPDALLKLYPLIVELFEKLTPSLFMPILKLYALEFVPIKNLID